MSLKLKCFLAALSANIIWGFVAVPIRFVQNYQAEQILFSRILASLIICWVFIISFQRKQLRIDINTLIFTPKSERKNLLLLLLTSGILITFNWYAFIYVINNVSLNSAAFAYMICPLITALSGFIILKEDINNQKIVGIIIALISVLILATGSLNEVLWSIITASFYAFYLIVQRVIKAFNKINMLGLQLIIAFTLILPLYLNLGLSIPSSLDFWFDIIVIAVLFTLVPLFLSLYALEGLPSSTVGIIIYINPVIAFGVAYLYFQEGITIIQALAYLLLVFAVIIFNWKILSGTIRKLASREATDFE
ncbi:EamA family transporter [Pedobacter puniceum]|jgi:chloramphenicol-sensitive protein RarD|uniref:EamA family transporter n=1 Tax=Pedobacter puniceum TaxID=2666136 RepID=A0A7K0FP18_9SPHI|nr:EamA family transporter [Pedobacter puniceum]MRX47381.1 EamA family transporter [Pedobacter puniceum]